MTKQVLDIGNCSFDHQKIKRTIEAAFDATVEQVHHQEDAIKILREGDFALVLVNRVLDRDDSEGIDLIAKIKSDPQLSGTRAMLISDFDQYQQQAVEIGAEPGFGKKTLDSVETQQRLARFLDRVEPTVGAPIGSETGRI